MSDYISRQAAIDAVVSAMIDGADAELVEGVMELLPSAHPQRKKGKWINDCTCSVCHWIHEDYKGFALVTNYNFCPRCGARMEGESE